MRTYTLGLILFCLSFFISYPLPATASEGPSKPLTISLELVDNNYQNKGRSHSVLTLTNTGNEDLPASGWKLFFNGGNPSSFDASIAQVKLFNGDLHYISPGPKFSKLAPGQSTTIQVLAGRIRNKTDFPVGFYLVLDKNPEQAYPVDVAIKSGTIYEKSDRALAEKIFNQNEKIKAISDDKLPRVFPTPVSYVEKGAPFELDNQVVIVTDKAFSNEADFLANSLKTALGKKPAIQAQATGKTISLRKKASLAAEGYELQVSASGIVISASASAGIFYGIQSLQTLLQRLLLRVRLVPLACRA